MGSIHTDLIIKDQRISTDHFTMNIGTGPRERVRLDGLRRGARLSGQAGYPHRPHPREGARYLTGLDLDLNSLTALHLTGTVDQVAIRPFGAGP